MKNKKIDVKTTAAFHDKIFHSRDSEVCFWESKDELRFLSREIGEIISCRLCVIGLYKKPLPKLLKTQLCNTVSGPTIPKTIRCKKGSPKHCVLVLDTPTH
mmetsp:Transcript_31586/g.48089  ORF Transcript_31586/g.48089 Transcript_31586/m.48089 type:complete len:101 (+) Transcript_31586:1059-1361(+)